MGTNYKRIPSVYEVFAKKHQLQLRLDQMDHKCPSSATDGFRFIEDGWDLLSPWDEFTAGLSIHLGKRSSGWKFLWNWNNGDYYKTKEELLNYIRSGRVVDEYGVLQDTEEFIKMALDWGKETGYDLESYYKDYPKSNISYNSKHEEYIDGLRVSTSTNFC